MDHEPHDHDGGLAHDLDRLLGRRRLLTLLAGAGLASLVGCGSGSDSNGSTAGCSTIPEETAGPFPGDGTNGPDALTDSGAIRSDIRSSFGAANGVAEGVLLTVDLNVLGATGSCTPIAGSAVYLWHCDRDGGYSMYSPGITDQNYLRGVQEADADGRVSFTTIVPGAYPGRWPHIHFEVYASLADATSGGSPVAISQLAMSPEVCEATYATAGYEASVRPFAETPLDSDGVFRDGSGQQVPAASGDARVGFTLELNVPV